MRPTRVVSLGIGLAFVSAVSLFATTYTVTTVAGRVFAIGT